MRTLTVEIADPAASHLLAPAGIASPHGKVTGLAVEGGTIVSVLAEAELGLSACLIACQGGPVTLCYAVDPASPGQPYPEAAFQSRRNRHSVADEALAEASREIARRAGGGRPGIEAIVAETEARFAYDHPEHRFNDGTDAVPLLSCGLTPGSCVDINTYLVAGLRAAGYDTAYGYGYFFPRERGGVTHDMHCWVVTRHAGESLEWDIAHHMKAGLGPTRPHPNPRPGERVALGHSMGHAYRHAGAEWSVKLLAEPISVDLATGQSRDLEIMVRYPA